MAQLEIPDVFIASLKSLLPLDIALELKYWRNLTWIFLSCNHYKMYLIISHSKISRRIVHLTFLYDIKKVWRSYKIYALSNRKQEWKPFLLTVLTYVVSTSRYIGICFLPFLPNHFIFSEISRLSYCLLLFLGVA